MLPLPLSLLLPPLPPTTLTHLTLLLLLLLLLQCTEVVLPHLFSPSCSLLVRGEIVIQRTNGARDGRRGVVIAVGAAG